VGVHPLHLATDTDKPVSLGQVTCSVANMGHFELLAKNYGPFGGAICGTCMLRGAGAKGLCVTAAWGIDHSSPLQPQQLNVNNCALATIQICQTTICKQVNVSNWSMPQHPKTSKHVRCLAVGHTALVSKDMGQALPRSGDPLCTEHVVAGN
jgi:hypothetical protein